MINVGTEVTNITKKLPKIYEVAPIKPTVRNENFRISGLEHKPAKLIALKNTPVTTVTAPDSAPKSVKKSLNINPKLRQKKTVYLFQC